jgi:uncharacterized protein (DUF1800 family)
MQSREEVELVKHLLRRFGLGASEAEVEFYGRGGYEKAVDRLLKSPEHEEPVTFGIEFLQNNDGNVVGAPQRAQAVWYAEQLVTNRPLVYKMAMFWHDHFATSAQKVSNGPTMLRHLHLLRDQGLGYFGELLMAVSKDPAMLYWLDNIENVKGKANENFAREIMELFTLGVGNYTEKDIQEAARSFTGWTYAQRRGNRLVPTRQQVPGPQTEFYLDAPKHDDGTKVIFGNSGEWSGEDVVGMLVSNPRTAQYLTEKLLKWFVEPNPSKATIEKFAQIFRKSNLNVKELVKAIMLSDEFKSEKVRRTILKNPFDFTIPMAREIGMGAAMTRAFEAAGDVSGNGEETERKRRNVVVPGFEIRRATSIMGMDLMFPPDVAGWGYGTEWISTSTMVARMDFGEELFTRYARALPNFTTFGADGQPESLVQNLLKAVDCQLPAEKVAQLNAAAKKASGGRVTQRNANATCGAVGKLISATPEFQFM